MMGKETKAAKWRDETVLEPRPLPSDGQPEEDRQEGGMGPPPLGRHSVRSRPIWGWSRLEEGVKRAAEPIYRVSERKASQPRQCCSDQGENDRRDTPSIPRTRIEFGAEGSGARRVRSRPCRRARRRSESRSRRRPVPAMAKRRGQTEQAPARSLRLGTKARSGIRAGNRARSPIIGRR